MDLTDEILKKNGVLFHLITQEIVNRLSEAKAEDYEKIIWAATASTFTIAYEKGLEAKDENKEDKLP